MAMAAPASAMITANPAAELTHAMGMAASSMAGGETCGWRARGGSNGLRRRLPIQRPTPRGTARQSGGGTTGAISPPLLHPPAPPTRSIHPPASTPDMVVSSTMSASDATSWMAVRRRHMV